MRHKRGISTTISTVILSATIISISLFAAFIATDLFEGQNQQAEFDQAKDTMFSLAVAIDGVSPKAEAASYVRFNPRSGGINFVNSWGHITMDLLNSTYSVRVIDEDLNALMFRGGLKASAGSPTILRGNRSQSVSLIGSTPIIYPGTLPQTWLFTQQYNGAKIWLDSSRVKLTNLGTFYYSTMLPNGSLASDIVNVAEIDFTRISYGYTISGSSVMDVKARCESMSSTQYRINSPMWVRVTVTLSNPQFTTSPQTYVSQSNVNSGGRPVVINLVVSNVNIYMLGG